MGENSKILFISVIVANLNKRYSYTTLWINTAETAKIHTEIELSLHDQDSLNVSKYIMHSAKVLKIEHKS